jgi:tetratricopeptide (TPR) repeat protein
MTTEAESVAQGRLVAKKLAEELGQNHLKTLEARCVLGYALSVNAEYDEAIRTLTEVHARLRKIVDDNSDEIIRAELFLAVVQINVRAFKEAVILLRHVVDVGLASGNDDSWPLNPGLADLAIALQGLGSFREEIPIRRRVLASYERLFGLGDLRTTAARSDLATALRSAGEFQEALDIDLELVGEQERIPNNRRVFLGTKYNLAIDLVGVGRTDEGERLGYEVYRSILEELSPDDPLRRRMEPFGKEFERYGKQLRRRDRSRQRS